MKLSSTIDLNHNFYHNCNSFMFPLRSFLSIYILLEILLGLWVLSLFLFNQANPQLKVMSHLRCII